MEPRDEAAKAEDAGKSTEKINMERRNKERHEFNKTRVKVMTDDIKGKVRFEDIDVIDQTLEKQEKLKKKKEHTPVPLLQPTEEKQEYGKDEDNQVNVQELKGYDDDDDVKTKTEMDDGNLSSVIKNRPPNIGLFKDARRRIDYVIVIEDDRIPLMQAIRTDFLTNVVKSGLELEFEAGVMKEHQNLIFIKVHATNKILEDYGETFGMKKYFKDEHLEFVKPDSSILNSLFRCAHEREWIKLVRRQYLEPLKYSNLERSYIVYMMLQHLRFGKPNNYYSLTRLLNNEIILDAYALHDGPYFFHPKQNSAYINARQILFYNWIGCKNIFTFQPINLINEYFGSKIGFYFAFYEFYNEALIIPMVLGICLFVYQYNEFHNKTLDETLPYPEDRIKHESDIACGLGGMNTILDITYICPKCRNLKVCPFLKLKNYCDSVYYKSFLDNKMILYHSFTICILVILFVRFWKRAENYWIWMWELGLPPKRSTIRSEYNVPYENPSRYEYTGIWAHHDGLSNNIYRYLVSNLVMLFCGLGVIIYACFLLWLNNYLLEKFCDKLIKKKIHPEYVVFSVVGTVGATGIFFCERICWYIAYVATNYENHRTHENFESSYILKVFGCSFAFTFAMLIYLALIKGTFYFTPIENYEPILNITVSNKKIASLKLDWLGDLFITNCGFYLGCWDELALYYTLTMTVKVVVMKVPRYFKCLPTDYNKGIDINRTVPSWEREYMLEPITETQIVQKINILMIQIALLALFGFINSLTMLMVFIFNNWDMRNEAKVMLLGRRRPLLFRCVGLGKWSYVLYFICYASAITMSLTLVKSSSLVERYVDDYLTEYSLDTVKDLDSELPLVLVIKRLSVFETKDYDKIKSAKKSLSEYKKTKPKLCYFGGSFQGSENEQPKWPHPNLYIDYPGGRRLTNRLPEKMFFKGILFLTYIHMLALVFLVILYNIPTINKRTKENMGMEKNLLRVHLQNIKVDKKHRADPVAE